MLWTLKAILWTCCAGGWLLVIAGLALGLGSSGVQAYVDFIPARLAMKGGAVSKKHQLPSPVVARLSSQRHRRNLYVFPNGELNLLKGPVTLTPPPSRGFQGNSIIAAHRDTHFRFLKDVRVGDEFDLQSEDGVFRFRVTDLFIVEISDRSLLMPSKDSVLTLVTCYPFYYVGSAPQRFIVRAALMDDGKRQFITDQK